MDTFEKLYTVEDIARMTMLTTRTIRNYLKDGLLTGRKIGGQWRFTQKDIETLFDNSSVEMDMQNSRRQDVMDFIDGVNTDIDGNIQICTIADYYCDNTEQSKKLCDKLCALISCVDTVQQHRFYYEYIEKESKARYTIFGTPSFVSKALTVIEEEWYSLNSSLGKFTGKAKEYADYRPSYPQPLIDFIYTKLGQPTRLKIADIGSGTGKMSRCLLNMGSTILGVEPNVDMRKEAEKLFSDNPSFHSISGTGENTTLPANSVDAVICAEAFHWFDNEKSRLEFKRILKQDGLVFLIWNSFSVENVYAGELDALCRKLCEKNGYNDIKVSKDERAENLFGKSNFEIKIFDNTFNQGFDGLLGGMLSASYAPKKGDDNFDEFVNGIGEIFKKYSDGGKIKTIFKTVCYFGRI